MSADWMEALRRACAREPQARVAKRLGYSPAVVNAVLHGKYRGSLAAVERAVRAELLAGRVRCPGVGEEIALSICLEHQGHVRAGNRLSAFRARMARWCPQCRHSKTGGDR